MTQQRKAPEHVLQVILTRADSTATFAQMMKQVSASSIELRDKYDAEHPDYVGNYESKYFSEVLKVWYESGKPQEYYTVDDFNDLQEIAFQCALYSVPSSFINSREDDAGEVDCLILGPFDKTQLEDLVQFANFIE